jgi:hypothetical protein
MNTFTDWPHGGDESCGWDAARATGLAEGSRLPPWLHLALGGGLVLGVAALLLVGATRLLPEARPRGAAPAAGAAEKAPAAITESPLVRAAMPADQPTVAANAPPPLPRLEAQAAEEPAPPATLVDSVPVAASVPPAEKEEKKEGLRRRNAVTEEELRRYLAGAAEVGIALDGASLVASYRQQDRESRLTSDPFKLASTVPLLRVIPGAATLSLRDGPGSILSPQAAAELDLLSRKLRVYLNATAPDAAAGQPRDMTALRARMREDLRGKRPEWLRAAAVPALNQLLMGEDTPMRGLLVELLTQIPEKPATVALAHRAAFDLAPEVRDAATEALRGRDPEAWRPVLVKALSYPWAPPADFAAEALIKLHDVGAVPELVVLLGKPHPGRPVMLPNKGVVIQEVVKVNHLRNCMLCHPPALRGNEPVVGIDPVWNLDGSSRDPTVLQAQASIQNVQRASGAHAYGLDTGTPRSRSAATLHSCARTSPCRSPP